MPMFRTPCCCENVSWWKGLLSRPMDPIKCSTCGIKYHDEGKRKFRLLTNLLIISSIGSIIAGFFPDFGYFIYVGYILFLLTLGTLFYDEFRIVRQGVLTRTTLSAQKKDLKFIIIGALLVSIGITYELYRAL